MKHSYYQPGMLRAWRGDVLASFAGDYVRKSRGGGYAGRIGGKTTTDQTALQRLFVELAGEAYRDTDEACASDYFIEGAETVVVQH